jgi:hypothetical protein
LAAGVVLLLGGAWLVGLWMVGLVLMLFGVAAAASAVLWDVDEDETFEKMDSHQRILERWRRAR